MAENLIVAVRGTGIAAACCQRILSSAGVGVQLDVTDRARVPAVMLSPATQALLADVFGRTDLFDGLWRIRRRVVAWGSAPPVDLPHSAIVVSEQELLQRLQFASPAPSGVPAWTIHTSRLLEHSVPHEFGSRTATATQVELSPGADPEACVMESLASGWLFLLPVSGHTAWLLSAGASRDELLAESRLVARSIGAVIAAGGSFPCHPRIADPLSGADWLACGSAALRFDPLCGDGTGHAVREAILACAVIRASASGMDSESLSWEYRLRLWAGLKRHLELCQQFYSTGGNSAWWQAEHDSLRAGLDWLSKRNAPFELGNYRLNGFSLERIG